MSLFSKNSVELCTLAVDEYYGEIASRIFNALLMKGRSSLSMLMESETLDLDHEELHRGLISLVQFHLLYFHYDTRSRTTFYEANPARAYNLLRAGKILDMIESSLGIQCRDVLQNILREGHVRIGDLKDGYQAKIDEENKAFGPSDAATPSSLVVKNTDELNAVLCRLISLDLVEVVNKWTLEPPHDILVAVRQNVTKKFFPGGVKGGKAKVEFDNKVADELRQIRDESKVLKRKLEQSGSGGAKRTHLEVTGTFHDEEDDKGPVLDPECLIRVNYEKCVVELRSRRLVQYAADTFSDVSSYVYATVLKLLTRNIARCRRDPSMDPPLDSELGVDAGFVTTEQILDELKTSIDLSMGIGKVYKHISATAAERISTKPPKKRFSTVDGGGGGGGGEPASDDDSDDMSDDSDQDDVKPNGEGAEKTAPPRLDRTTLLRRHLLLLAESRQHFVRHCGPDQWTVDFEIVMEALQESELDSTIDRTLGQKSLRLVRILRAMGKLDEKALVKESLMSKSDVQKRMSELFTNDFVNIQEVPRDTKADVKKSMFLYHSQTQVSLRQMLDKTLFAMVRCLQVLDARRERNKDVLDLAKRSDVRGKEEEMMTEESYRQYVKFLETEKRLLVQVGRMDDLVGVLRDY